MAEQAGRPRLQIVRIPKRISVSQADFEEPGLQATLFPVSRRGLLIVVYFPEVTEQEFRETLEYAKPSFILEMRSAPRFDIGTLDRQQAFQVFKRHNANYLDLSSAQMGTSDSEAVFSSLTELLRSKRISFENPVMLLINTRESNQEFTARILDTVSSYNPGASELFEVPRFVDSA